MLSTAKMCELLCIVGWLNKYNQQLYLFMYCALFSVYKNNILTGTQCLHNLYNTGTRYMHIMLSKPANCCVDGKGEKINILSVCVRGRLLII